MGVVRTSPFDHARIPREELVRLWNASHPQWYPPASVEAVRGELVDILAYMAGMGELPPRYMQRLGWDVDIRRGEDVIREEDLPDDEEEDTYLQEVR